MEHVNFEIRNFKCISSPFMIIFVLLALLVLCNAKCGIHEVMACREKAEAAEKGGLAKHFVGVEITRCGEDAIVVASKTQDVIKTNCGPGELLGKMDSRR